MDMSSATHAGRAQGANPHVELVSTRLLLAAGLIAGPLYMIIGTIQAVTRDGFDISRHAWSMLTLGSYGWVQTLNFLATGLLIIAAATGLRRATGSHWASRLLTVHGLGVMAAGVFVPDLALGFPPGAPEETQAISWHAIVHFTVGGLGFICFIAACFVMARMFSRYGDRARAGLSRVTGTIFLAAFAGIASGSTGPATLAFVGAILLSFVWLTATCHWAYARL